MASRWVWCIFQFPLTRSRRSATELSPQGGQAGKVALLDELQGRASAGRDVVDLAVEAEFGERSRAVTTVGIANTVIASPRRDLRRMRAGTA